MLELLPVVLIPRRLRIAGQSPLSAEVASVECGVW